MSDVIALHRGQDTADVPSDLLSTFAFFATVTNSRVDVRCNPHCVLSLAQWASKTYPLVQTAPDEIPAPPWSACLQCADRICTHVLPIMYITLDTEHGGTTWKPAVSGIPVFSVNPSHSDLKMLADWIEAGLYLGIAPSLREILLATYAHACVHMADPEINNSIAAATSFQPHANAARNIICNVRLFEHVVLPESTGDDGL